MKAIRIAVIVAALLITGAAEARAQGAMQQGGSLVEMCSSTGSS